MFTTSRFYPRTLDISSEFLLPRAYLHTNQLTQSSISENIVDAILRIDLTIKRVPLFTMCLVERFDLCCCRDGHPNLYTLSLSSVNSPEI